VILYNFIYFCINNKIIDKTLITKNKIFPIC